MHTNVDIYIYIYVQFFNFSVAWFYPSPSVQASFALKGPPPAPKARTTPCLAIAMFPFRSGVEHLRFNWKYAESSSKCRQKYQQRACYDNLKLALSTRLCWLGMRTSISTSPVHFALFRHHFLNIKRSTFFDGCGSCHFCHPQVMVSSCSSSCDAWGKREKDLILRLQSWTSKKRVLRRAWLVFRFRTWWSSEKGEEPGKVTNTPKTVMSHPFQKSYLHSEHI